MRAVLSITIFLGWIVGSSLNLMGCSSAGMAHGESYGAPTGARNPAGGSGDALEDLREFNANFNAATNPQSREYALYRKVTDLTPNAPEDTSAEKSVSFQKDLRDFTDIFHDLRDAFVRKYECRISTHVLAAYDPITKGMGGIQVRLYEPKTTTAGVSAPLTPVRSVLLVPPTGGENALDKGYADLFCSSGIRTVILERWDGDWDSAVDPDLHDRGAVKTLAAIRHSIEFLAPHGEKVGILGTSVGAIASALAMGYEPRIDVAALIVGGVNLRDIIPTSTEDNLTRLRTERSSIPTDNGPSSTLFEVPISGDGYKSLMQSHINVEPADQLPNTSAHIVWMQIASQDKTVPTRDQYALREVFRQNHRIQLLHAESTDEYPNDHLHTILHTYGDLRSNIRDLFLKNLQAH